MQIDSRWNPQAKQFIHSASFKDAEPASQKGSFRAKSQEIPVSALRRIKPREPAVNLPHNRVVELHSRS